MSVPAKIAEQVVSERLRPSGIVDAHGRPVRRHNDGRCPACGAAADTRVTTSGFGDSQEICCGNCGQEVQGS